MLAEALREWLPSVLQNVQPWMSEFDIPMGSRWYVDLARKLENAKVGIVCVTSENQNSPWVLFEAGALSKIVDANLVIPYLLNIRPGEVQGPLVQFQGAVTNRDDTFKLVTAVNRALDTLALSHEGLNRSFEKWWPELAASITNITQTVESDPPLRPEREILEEILDLTRQNTRKQVERITIAEDTATRRQQDLWVMTHQIQKPLIPLVGLLSKVAQEAIPDSARSSIEDARELVQDALALAYGVSSAFAVVVEGHDATFSLDTIDVQGELRKVVSRVQRTTERGDLHFMFINTDRFPKLQLDPNALTSILYSLIHNATKFADSNSEVVFEFSLAGPDAMPVLTITSTGEPISPRERDRVFEKFARGQGPGHDRYAGVGLGLWVARELMRRLGGDITVDLSADNPRVARFVVHFSSTSIA